MPEKNNIIGQQIIHLPLVTSTNDYAFRQARAGAVEGCIVRADEQTAGKGRRGKPWHSARNGGLWFSVILRPQFPSRDAGLISFFASLAVQKSISRHFKLQADLKWPNDLLIQHRKICGILSEVDFRNSQINFIILGIGLNLHQRPEEFTAHLREIAGSLAMFTDQEIDADSFFEQLVADLDFYYQKVLKEGFEVILEEWKANCRFLKQIVSVKRNQGNLIGVFEDLLPDGAMLFRQNGDLIKLTSAELEFQK